ncbi:MAG: hypothetical protein AAGC44_06550 [Planctomycetota bacterium]
MKYAIVIFGGAADQPLEELQDKTPLQVARCPTLKRMGQTGRFGQLTALPEPIEPTPDAAVLSMLGYDPLTHYPGNAPLRAVGLGIAVQPGDWVMNLSLLSAPGGLVGGFDRAVLPPAEARALLAGLVEQLDLGGATVHPTDDGLHLMVDPASLGRDWAELSTAPPSVLPGRTIRRMLPTGGKAGERLQSLIAQSEVFLQGHEMNQARAEMGEALVTHLWPWGQGQVASLPGWADGHGKSAVLLSQDPAVRGVAKSACLGWMAPDPGAAVKGEDERARHDPEGDLVRLGCAAVEALDAVDVVVIDAHEAAQAGLDGHVANKIDAIELIDQHVLKPIELAITARGEDYRLLATPLYATLTDERRCESLPVPFVVTGYKMQGVVPRPVTEPAAEHADLRVDYGHELMEFFLKSGVRG